MFKFKILSKQPKTKARLGEFSTPHGKLMTPELAFVATEGEIKSIPKEILPTLPVNLIIVNTFHLWAPKQNKFASGQVKNIIGKFNHLSDGRLQDGKKTNKTIHDYANFQKPIMSDSGGFQVFSMGFGKAHGVGKIISMFPGNSEKSRRSQKKSEEIGHRNNLDKSNISVLSGLPTSDFRSLPNYSDSNNPLTITDQGVIFPFNNQQITLTPELSIEIQQKIGADIIFAFDECTSPLNSYEYTKRAMERTHRWLERCIKQASGFQSLPSNNKQALFAIVQGGYFEDLRKQSAQYMAKIDVPGFGIGGALGTTKNEVRDVLEWTIPYLPEEKPRHLLGIGKVRDIFESVERGVDSFDCVIPTREARHRVLYTKKGRVNLQKMKNSSDLIDPPAGRASKNCRCLACQEKITYRQLAQLFSQKDSRAYFFATVHNIQFYADLMKAIREAIENKKFSILKEKWLRYY